MMDAPAKAPASPAAHHAPHALRGLLAAILEALRTRLDLAAVEFEIHLLALVRVLLWTVGAVACVLLGFAFALVALVVALWDTHRMLALLGGSALFLAVGAGLGYLGMRGMRNHPGVLEGSLQQLAEDTRRARGES
jgi:uncharacterized membrane protein YqjE